MNICKPAFAKKSTPCTMKGGRESLVSCASNITQATALTSEEREL